MLKVRFFNLFIVVQNGFDFHPASSATGSSKGEFAHIIDPSAPFFKIFNISASVIPLQLQTILFFLPAILINFQTSASSTK